METEYIEKLIEFACNRIINDLKEGKFTAYFVAQQIGRERLGASTIQYDYWLNRVLRETLWSYQSP